MMQKSSNLMWFYGRYVVGQGTAGKYFFTQSKLKRFIGGGGRSEISYILSMGDQKWGGSNSYLLYWGSKKPPYKWQDEFFKTC
jgi:hypothetical protein